MSSFFFCLKGSSDGMKMFIPLLTGVFVRSHPKTGEALRIPAIDSPSLPLPTNEYSF